MTILKPPLKKLLLPLTALLLVCWTFAVYAADPAQPIAQHKPQSRYQRIISLKPNITLILERLGLKNEVVGITKFCPKISADATVVGDYNSIDVEAVIRLKPDLVLISTENTQDRQVEVLKSANINIKVFDFKTYDQMQGSLLAIAELLDLMQRGQDIVKDMEQKLEALKTEETKKSPTPRTFIIVVQRQPLMVASGNTFISSLFAKIGWKNVFAMNQIPYPVMDEEEVIRELVDYTFDISQMSGDEPASAEFLNKQVIFLKIEDFIAAPQSVDHLVRLVGPQS